MTMRPRRLPCFQFLSLAGFEPGNTNCSPANSVSVVNGADIVGLTNINTRRSASFSVTSSPARSSSERRGLYRQMCAVAFGCGSEGLTLAIWVHSGERFLSVISVRKVSVAFGSSWIMFCRQIALEM